MATYRTSAIYFTRYIGTDDRTISWTDYATRDNYFNSKAHDSIEGIYYIRMGEPIRIARSQASMQAYNYGWFHNGGIRRYFFIDSVSYVDENTCEVSMHIDLLTSYLPQGLNSFIEQTNVVTGDDSVPGVAYNGTLFDTYCGADIFTGAKRTVVNLAYLKSSSTSANQYVTSVVTKYRVRDNSEISYRVFGGYAALQDVEVPPFYNNVVSTDATASVVSSYTLPSDAVAGFFDGFGSNSGFLTGFWKPNISFSIPVDTGNLKVVNDNELVVIYDISDPTNHIEIPLARVSGSGPLVFNKSTDPVSGVALYQLQSGLNGDNENEYKITIDLRQDLPVINNPGDVSRGMALNNAKYNSAQNQLRGNNIASYLIGGAFDIATGLAGAIGGAVGRFMGIEGAGSVGWESLGKNFQVENDKKHALANAGLQPLTSTGAYSPGSKDLDYKGIVCVLKKVPPRAKQQLTNAYLVDGYMANTLGIPSLRDGGKHLYAGQINIRTDYATAFEEEAMRRMFTAGVWYWPNESSIFSY